MLPLGTVIVHRMFRGMFKTPAHIGTKCFIYNNIEETVFKFTHGYFQCVLRWDHEALFIEMIVLQKNELRLRRYPFPAAAPLRFPCGCAAPLSLRLRRRHRTRRLAVDKAARLCRGRLPLVPPHYAADCGRISHGSHIARVPPCPVLRAQREEHADASHLMASTRLRTRVLTPKSSSISSCDMSMISAPFRMAARFQSS